MHDFTSFVDEICKRPAQYVGKCSLLSVCDYLSGYDQAVMDANRSRSNHPLAGWMRWVESRFLISHGAWHWTRIMLHVYGSDSVALEKLPELYREFLTQREAIGVDGIEEERRRRFAEAYGEDWHEPSSTKTTRVSE